MCFPVNFPKFLRTSFLQKTSKLLLLPLTIFAKSSILDVWQGSESACEHIE